MCHRNEQLEPSLPGRCTVKACVPSKRTVRAIVTRTVYCRIVCVIVTNTKSHGYQDGVLSNREFHLFRRLRLPKFRHLVRTSRATHPRWLCCSMRGLRLFILIKIREDSFIVMCSHCSYNKTLECVMILVVVLVHSHDNTFTCTKR